MSEKTSEEDKILDEAVRYITAASKELIYKHPERWDKNGQDPATLTFDQAKRMDPFPTLSIHYVHAHCFISISSIYWY